MNRFLLVLVFVGVSTSAFAQAHIGLSGGMNLCMENGDAKCDDISAGYSFTLSPGYMFHENVGINLDVNFSSVSSDAEFAPDLSYLHVIPMITGVFPAGPAKISVGIGMGYNSLSIKLDSVELFTASTFTAIKASLMVLFPINEQFSAGIGSDYVHNGTMEMCNPDDSTQCIESDMISQLQVNLGMKYTF
jgi:hypothetical protein